MANNATLAFSVAATINLGGNGTFSDNETILSYQNVPANLAINQASGTTFNAGNYMKMVAVYLGPGTDVSFDQWTDLEGSLISKTLTLTDNDALFYDESLGPTSTASVSTVR